MTLLPDSDVFSQGVGTELFSGRFPLERVTSRSGRGMSGIPRRATERASGTRAGARVPDLQKLDHGENGCPCTLKP